MTLLGIKSLIFNRKKDAKMDLLETLRESILISIGLVCILIIVAITCGYIVASAMLCAFIAKFSLILAFLTGFVLIFNMVFITHLINSYFERK